MRLDRLIISNIMRSFIILALIFLPVLYLSDFFFAEGFSPFGALKKLPMRYGQSIANLLLWGVWLGVKNIQKKYSQTTFISIGFRKKDAFKSLLIIASLFVFIDLALIVPAHDLLGAAEIRSTSWSIKNIKKQTYFIHKNSVQNSQNFEAFWVTSKLHKSSAIMLNKKITITENNATATLFPKDFYIIWNEPKKLSWMGLKKYNQYLQYHKRNNKNIIKQYNIFFSRAILLIGMVLCGFALGWEIGINKIFACAVLSCWIAQVCVFLPFTYAIVGLWSNCALWIGLGLWYLL